MSNICFGEGDALYERYHDEEWGRPVRDERGLYEKLCLEAFQSGLAWITILRKRDGFRAAFAGFDPEAVARFGKRDVNRLLDDAGIVRNRLKIDAAIANAKATVDAARRAARAAGADLGSRADRPPQGAALVGGRRGAHARVDCACEGAQAQRLSLRRPDDRLRADAGVRARQRPPLRLPRPRRRRAGATRRMTPARLRALRCAAQLLAGEPVESATEAVRHHLALQAQDLRAAQLALRARVPGLAPHDVDRALNEREFVVTWVNRGTLHFVCPDDVPWLVALTGPTQAAAVARRLKLDGIDANRADRAIKAIATALADDGPS